MRPKQRWLYHSKALQASAAAPKPTPWTPVLSDIAPTSLFWLPPPHPAAVESRSGPLGHIWYGSAGSRTRPHFDMYENFFVQVRNGPWHFRVPSW